MSSSGGSPLNNAANGIKDKFQRWKNDPFGETSADSIDGVTGGLVRYNPTTGKGTEGFTLHHSDEWVGELDGRNKARLQTYQTDKDIDKAAAAQKTNFLNQQLQAYRTDVAASQAAQGVRNTSNARSLLTTRGNGGLGGAGQQDMLGM